MQKLILAFVIVVGVAALLLGNCGQSAKAERIGPPLEDPWVMPAKAQLTVGRGVPLTRELTIHNGSASGLYTILLKTPDFVGDGYGLPPIGITPWVTIENGNPTLQPYETRQIRVTILIPSNAICPERFEIWLAVKNLTLKGMAQIEIVSRWQVSVVGNLVPLVDGPTAKSLVVPSSDLFLGAAGVAGGSGGFLPSWTMWALGFILLGCIGLYVFLVKGRVDEED